MNAIDTLRKYTGYKDGLRAMIHLSGDEASGLGLWVVEFRDSNGRKPARIQFTIQEDTKGKVTEICEKLGLEYGFVHDHKNEETEEIEYYFRIGEFEFDSLEEAIEAVDETVNRIKEVREKVRASHV